MKKRIQRIAILGYFGVGNLGDEAVVGILLENLRRQWTDADIFAICLNPEDTEKQHGIRAFPIRRLSRTRLDGNGPTFLEGLLTNKDSSGAISFLKRWLYRIFVVGPREIVFLLKSLQRIRGLDMMIVGGSGQLIDVEGGPWNHPYNHFKWAVLSRLVGAKFVLFSVGAGPIETRMGKFFIRHSLSMSDYCSFRDSHSRDLIRKIGVRHRDSVFPDQAFGLAIESYLEQSPKASVVAVAPIAYADPRHWYEPDADAYQEYLSKMTDFVKWLISMDFTVVLFHTQVGGDDVVVSELIHRVQDEIHGRLPTSIIEHKVQWYSDSLKAISMADCVIASRFHAVLFSILLSRPVIGLSYHQKINDMMASLKYGDYVISISNFDVETLKKKFLTIQAKKQAITELAKPLLIEYREQLRNQYRTVLSDQP